MYTVQYIVDIRYLHLKIIRNMVLFLGERVSEKIRSPRSASVKSLSRGARRDNSRLRDNIIVK